MRGHALTASGLNKGWFRGWGMPLSPTLHGWIDVQVGCSKQVAEELLVPPPCGVQQRDALRQSDMLLKFFGILRCSLDEQIAPQFPSAMPLNVLPPCVLILCILMGCDAKRILYLGAFMPRLLRCTTPKKSAALSDLDQLYFRSASDNYMGFMYMGFMANC